jgi:hypothetical protein
MSVNNSTLSLNLFSTKEIWTSSGFHLAFTFSNIDRKELSLRMWNWLLKKMTKSEKDLIRIPEILLLNADGNV